MLIYNTLCGDYWVRMFSSMLPAVRPCHKLRINGPTTRAGKLHQGVSNWNSDLWLDEIKLNVNDVTFLKIVMRSSDCIYNRCPSFHNQTRPEFTPIVHKVNKL